MRSTLWAVFNLIYGYAARCQLAYNQSLCRKEHDPNGYQYANVIGAADTSSFEVLDHPELPWEAMPAHVSWGLLLNPCSKVYHKEYKWPKREPPKPKNRRSQSSSSLVPNSRDRRQMFSKRGRESTISNLASQPGVHLPYERLLESLPAPERLPEPQRSSELQRHNLDDSDAQVPTHLDTNLGPKVIEEAAAPGGASRGHSSFTTVTFI